MKARLGKRFHLLWDVALVACSICILVWAWSTHSQNRQLEGRISELRSQMVKPYKLNGFEVDLDAFTHVFEEWEGSGIAATATGNGPARPAPAAGKPPAVTKPAANQHSFSLAPL